MPITTRAQALSALNRSRRARGVAVAVAGGGKKTRRRRSRRGSNNSSSGGGGCGCVGGAAAAMSSIKMRKYKSVYGGNSLQNVRIPRALGAF